MHKQKTNTFKDAQTKQYETKKVYKNTPELVLVWPSAVVHGSYPEVWFVFPVRLDW